MKNIKNFRAFFESKENKYSNSPLIYIKTTIDEDYGLPCLLIDENEQKITNVISEEELIDDSLNAPYGPFTGPSSWENLVDAHQEYVDDPSKENFETVSEWMVDLGLSKFDTKKFLEDVNYFYEVKNAYTEDNAKYIRDKIADGLYNYILVNLGFSIYNPLLNLDGVGQQISTIKQMLQTSDLPLIIFAYNNKGEVFRLVDKGIKSADNQHETEFLPIDTKKEDFQNDISIFNDIIEALEKMKTQSPLDFVKSIQSMKNIKAFEKIILYFQKDSDIIKGGSVLNKFLDD